MFNDNSFPKAIINSYPLIIHMRKFFCDPEGTTMVTKKIFHCITAGKDLAAVLVDFDNLPPYSSFATGVQKSRT